MSTRQQNEKRFKKWEDLLGGGRRYWMDRKGIISGFQRMIKVVDANEITLQVVQEIYNDEEVLIARHQKYPVDSGHEVLSGEE